jgi:hypothetical protein
MHLRGDAVTPTEEQALIRDVALIKAMLAQLLPVDRRIKSLVDAGIEKSLAKVKRGAYASPHGHYEPHGE